MEVKNLVAVSKFFTTIRTSTTELEGIGMRKNHRVGGGWYKREQKKELTMVGLRGCKKMC